MTDATTALLQSLAARFAEGESRYTVQVARSRGWESVSFRGRRIEVAFTLEGENADEEDGEFLVWPGTDRFKLKGHLLADVSVLEEERRPGFARIRLDALTVEDR